MGKNLSTAHLVQRTGKLAFYNVPGTGSTSGVLSGTLTRMEGFTDLGYSQNPKEYSRQYVDEDFDRTDIVGYAPSISYSFDRYIGNSVLTDIVNITENELIGEKMVRYVLSVDMTTVTGSTTKTAYGKLRQYAVIPDSNGDSTDCLTYSGNFKARGLSSDVVVTTTNDFQTIATISYDASTSTIDTVITASIDGDAVSLTGGAGTGNVYSGTVSTGSSVTIKVVADGASCITFAKDSGSSFTGTDTGSTPYTSDGNIIASGENRFVITVVGTSTTATYVVNLTGN